MDNAHAFNSFSTSDKRKPIHFKYIRIRIRLAFRNRMQGCIFNGTSHIAYYSLHVSFTKFVTLKWSFPRVPFLFFCFQSTMLSIFHSIPCAWQIDNLFSIPFLFALRYVSFQNGKSIQCGCDTKRLQKHIFRFLFTKVLPPIRRSHTKFQQSSIFRLK